MMDDVESEEEEEKNLEDENEVRKKRTFDFLSLFFQKSYICTVWKFQNFSAIQILREINF